MFTTIRKWLGSWVVLAILGLVILAFIVTGIQDPFGGGARGQGVLAKVGDATVTEQETQRLFQRAVERVRETQPDMTIQQAAREGALDQLLGEVVAARSLEQFAMAQGMVAGDAAIDAEITQQPAFQFGGRFSQTTYENALKAQGISDRELREGLAGDILRRKLLAPLAYAFPITRGHAEPYAALMLEARAGLIGVVPSQAMRLAKPPTDADLQAFYNENRVAFTTPERRGYRYALIDPVNIPFTRPTDAEIDAYMARNPARFSPPSRRRLLQVVTQDEAQARAFAGRARDVASFTAAAAEEFKAAPGDLAIGDLTQDALARATSEAVADAVFKAAPGGIVGPVRSDFGWHVLAVEAEVAAEARPADSLRAEALGAIIEERRATGAAELADKAQEALANGRSIADVAKELGLQLITVEPQPREGSGGFGALEPHPKVLTDAAFQADPGDDASVEEIGQGRSALFQLGEVVAPTLPPLAQNRELVLQLFTLRALSNQARDMANAIADEVRKGKPLPQALAERRLPPPQPVTGRRIDVAQAPQGSVPPPVLLMFSIPPDVVQVAPAERGAGWYIVQVVRTQPGDTSQAPQLLEQASVQFTRLVTDELLAQFARATEKEVGVTRNETAIAAMRARLTGEAAARAATP
jgi:peptidyl-prolyl cis-trans isomerase D